MKKATETRIKVAILAIVVVPLCSTLIISMMKLAHLFTL